MPYAPAKSGMTRLAHATLYALLLATLALLACLGDRLHTPEQPYGPSAAASSEIPSPPQRPEGETADGPDSPDLCPGARSQAAAVSKSWARVPAPATTAAAPTDPADLLARDPRSTARRLPPSGGRSALVALCQWRI
ncbi:hypothetical protein [Streptomyces sp. V4I2]|uniref:hypothetical protein n=1 Tax=Streptomyces sp. V4I2 TaxID=3042280 RepID=UPI00277FBD0F|nr:hypothetical protein [Streptomyces sp. V4I2]MDQ1044944.1 hypothetical protein [Streptomyces sp. V4I2]